MRRRAWIAGASVGATTGLLALELPSVGYVLLAAFMAPALMSGNRVAAIGGVTVAFGAAWLGLLATSSASCRPPDCIAPDLTPWLAIGVAATAVGVALTAAMLRTLRSSRAP